MLRYDSRDSSRQGNMGYPIGCVQGIHHTISDVSDARLTDIHFIQTIMSQATRDDSISQLLSNMGEVDMFLTENDLAALTSMKSVVVRIFQQTLEHYYFLRDYSKSQNFWIRPGKNVVSETYVTVKGYNTVFDDLMQQFRDRAAWDMVVVVHWMLEGIQELIEGADLSGMK